jgi:putative transcriptional regulator
MGFASAQPILRALNRLATGERVPVEIACDPRVLVSKLSALGVDACVATVPIPDVKRIREQLGLSQSDFALRFGLDVDAIRNWEQERTAPNTAARVLLAVIDKYPTTVEAVLNDQREGQNVGWVEHSETHRRPRR